MVERAAVAGSKNGVKKCNSIFPIPRGSIFSEQSRHLGEHEKGEREEYEQQRRQRAVHLVLVELPQLLQVEHDDLAGQLRGPDGSR